MIEGLHCDVEGKELKALLGGRLDYHTDRLKSYETQLDQMRTMNKNLEEEARQIGKTSTRSPIESLEEAIKRHQNQCIYYKFMAEHVVPSETYRLSEQDLYRLGISPDRF